MWKEIIEDNHCWYNKNADYSQLVSKNPITDGDLDYFRGVINSGMKGGQSGYDSFPDNGGIDIAAVLLEEVVRVSNGSSKMALELDISIKDNELLSAEVQRLKLELSKLGGHANNFE